MKGRANYGNPARARDIALGLSDAGLEDLRRARAQGATLTYDVDPHWNARGNQAVADVIYRELMFGAFAPLTADWGCAATGSAP